MLSALVPRHLRVRGSIQVAGTRLPLRGFCVLVGCVFLGVVAVIFGAPLEPALWSCGALMLLGLLLVEGWLWGRTSPQIVRLLWRHARRPRRLRRAPQIITLPPERTSDVASSRRPRWQVEAERAEGGPPADGRRTQDTNV